jgi:hypothetical protein
MSENKKIEENRQELVGSGDSTDNWSENEVRYLVRLKNYCDIISKILSKFYRKYTLQERSIAIPSLLLTSINSLASFGVEQFGDFKAHIPLVVGISSGIVSILTALNSYLEITQNRETCKNGTREINRLSREIVLELSLDIRGRTVSGLSFCRQCFAKLQTIYSTLPIVNILYKNDYAKFSEIPPLDINFNISSKMSDNENVSIKISESSNSDISTTDYNHIKKLNKQLSPNTIQSPNINRFTISENIEEEN